MDEGDTVKPDKSEEELSLDEQSLQEKVRESEEAMARLEADLRDVDFELTQLAGQNQKFEALGNVCRSLEELENLGGTGLFWKAEDGDVDACLREARERIHEYGESIVEVERRRDGIAAKIGNQNSSLDVLHYELLDAIEREERRRSEWLVERDADELPKQAMVMPWQRRGEEDRRYRRSLGSSLATSLVLAILIGSIAIPIPDKSKKIELPERMAKLVHEALPPPPPAPEAVIDEEIPEPEPETEPELAEEIPPELVPESSEEPRVAEVQEPDIKEQVKSKGILAFRDSFASRSSLRPSAQLGSQARLNSAGENAVGRTERAMVTTNAPGSSGGINLASISRDVGGGGPGMGGVAVSRVSSSIGSGGDGFGDRPMSGGAMAGRTDEEIQIVFDRYKAALYRLYNRELRKNPTLRGQVIIKLTIEPDGSVSFCALQSSDMNAPVLADQVIERVTTFDFGAKEDISAVTIIYPIDFLPAA
jgi:outer membrane biosynthesis protein TonB